MHLPETGLLTQVLIQTVDASFERHRLELDHAYCIGTTPFGVKTDGFYLPTMTTERFPGTLAGELE